MGIERENFSREKHEPWDIQIGSGESITVTNLRVLTGEVAEGNFGEIRSAREVLDSEDALSTLPFEMKKTNREIGAADKNVNEAEILLDRRKGFSSMTFIFKHGMTADLNFKDVKNLKFSQWKSFDVGTRNQFQFDLEEPLEVAGQMIDDVRIASFEKPADAK